MAEKSKTIIVGVPLQAGVVAVIDEEREGSAIDRAQFVRDALSMYLQSLGYEFDAGILQRPLRGGRLGELRGSYKIKKPPKKKY